MSTILLVGVDLFFRGKLEGLLPGHRLVATDSLDAPDLVIVDIARVEPGEVVDAWPDIPILGYTNHTDKSGLQRAHTAGFDQVIVKSALVERASELVDELTIIVAPVVLGGGKRLFEGFSRSFELEHLGMRQSPLATFVDYRVKRP